MFSPGTKLLLATLAAVLLSLVAITTAMFFNLPRMGDPLVAECFDAHKGAMPYPGTAERFESLRSKDSIVVLFWAQDSRRDMTLQRIECPLREDGKVSKAGVMAARIAAIKQEHGLD